MSLLAVQQLWDDIIIKVHIVRDLITVDNFLDYDTTVTHNLVIGGHKYGTVYAVDNLYCAYKSVTKLLNKKDALIVDFKRTLFHMHENGLMPLDTFEEFLDSYGISEALPIYTKEQFDAGFNNHTIFKRDCIILINGGRGDNNLKHLLAYKASGKPYVKLLEMVHQKDQTILADKIAQPPKFHRKAATKVFSGTRQDFYHMLRQAFQVLADRHANGLLVEDISTQTLIILGQLSLHKSFIYQYIDFQNEYSQIVFSTLCVMLNRKSNLVSVMPPKTINLPRRYVSNVTQGEKLKNAKYSTGGQLLGAIGYGHLTASLRYSAKALYAIFKKKDTVISRELQGGVAIVCATYVIARWYSSGSKSVKRLRNPKMSLPVVAVSQSAIIGVQPANLAVIYAYSNIPVQNLTKDKVHHWEHVKGQGIVASPQPGVTRQCAQAISKAGLYVHAKSLQENTSTGGGHSCIRYCSDSMFAKSLSYISSAKEPIIIIDVGAKYKSVQTILNLIYKNKKEADLLGNVCVYIPVRPNVDDYDQAYHSQNLKAYNNFQYHDKTKQLDGGATIISYPVQQLRIQDVDWSIIDQFLLTLNLPNDTKRFVIMNDCHYYFDGQFSLPFEHTLLLSGMNYVGYTGKYVLPFSDGYFQIDNNHETQCGQVCMFPQSTSKKYTHPYTYIDKVDCEIDLGWISFFQKIQLMQINQKYDIYTPNVISVGCNVQDHYFHEYYSGFSSNIDTIKAQLARWPKQSFKDQVEVRYDLQQDILYTEDYTLPLQKQLAYMHDRLFTIYSGLYNMMYNQPYYSYKQSAYIHLPKAGQISIPTICNPDATIHDQIPFCERAKKPMVGYIEPESFDQLHQIHGLQPHEVSYDSMPHSKKPKQPKQKCAKMTRLDTKNHYVIKDFPEEIILDSAGINPLIKVPGQDQQYQYNYQQCIKQYRNALIEKQTSTVIPTGLTHLRMTQHEDLATVEFATTSIHNQIFALYGRCFKTQQRFSTVHLDAFETMTQRFILWFNHKLNDIPAGHFDPLQWLHNKHDFPFEKKQKYQKTILQQLKGNKSDFYFSYKSMLKSGEEFLVPMSDLDAPKIISDKKPRDIKIPSPQGCGLFTALQSEFWAPIKTIYPGFVQGYLPQDLKALFKEQISKYDSVISDDGSAFESTQFYDLQQIVDKPIMLMLLTWLKKNNIDNPIFQDLWNNMTLDTLVEVICPEKNLVFVKMPNDGQPWDSTISRWWNRDWKQALGPAENNYDKYLPYWIRGTTFSGVPQTTLMNTFRKLTYSFYDIYVATGKDAWISDEFFVGAAGDDGITMGNNSDGQLTDIQRVKLQLSDPAIIRRGLGQCIAEAPITESWNFDFCSKLILKDHGVFMGRDLLKTLTQKQYFTKKNLAFQAYPHLHVQAILDGLTAEKSSRLLEDIIRVRLEKVRVSEHSDYVLPPKKNYHSLTTDTGYEFEDVINSYLGIDLSDLIMHIESGQSVDTRPHKVMQDIKDTVQVAQKTRVGYIEPLQETVSEHPRLIPKIASDQKYTSAELGYVQPYKEASQETNKQTQQNNNQKQQQNVNPNEMQRQNKKLQRQAKRNNNKQAVQKKAQQQVENNRPTTQKQINFKQSQGQHKDKYQIMHVNNNRAMQMKFRNDPAMDYVKSILNPFNADAVRGPSDFHLPTSVLNHRYELDYTFGTTHGIACLLPQHMTPQASTNGPAWFNVQPIHSTASQTSYLGGEGILIGNCPLAGYATTAPASGGQTATSPRFTTARLLRVGIKIYPTANLTVKSGSLVIAQVPGKTQPAPTGFLMVPTVQQLKQYPTSVTVNLATIDTSGQSYVWLPLDVDDTIFQSPAAAVNTQDNQSAMQQFRNPIWACFEGISAQDSYRFEIYSSYEYVPTMSFESWANTSVTKTPNTAFTALKQILNNDLFRSVAGIVGQELTQSKYAAGMLKPAFDTFMSIV